MSVTPPSIAFQFVMPTRSYGSRVSTFEFSSSYRRTDELKVGSSSHRCDELRRTDELAFRRRASGVKRSERVGAKRQ